MDVTNPGLVNVADQANGNPSTAVQSLAIPEDSDVLTPVADEGYPRAEDVTATEDGGNSKGPTPTVTNPINQPAVSPPLSLAQLPGVPPTFAPFPQTNLVNTVDNQQTSQNQIQPPSFDVIGNDVTIQTNQTDATRRQYTVSSVVDADTGGPVVVPFLPIVGNFTGIYQEGSNLIVLSPAPFDPNIVDGAIVTLASSNPSYNFPQTVFNLQQIGGLFNYASKGNPSGTIVTLSSLSPFPVSLVSGEPVTIYGSSVAAYNGPNVAQNVISVNGTFDEVDSAGPGQITVVSYFNPSGLANGNLVWLDGIYNTAHPQPASKVVNDSDTILSIVNNGSGLIRVTSTHALSANFIANGQMVTIATPNYNGTYAVSNITGGTFDLAVAWTVDELPSTGSWNSYTFNLPISYAGTYGDLWSCNTFDISFSAPTYTTTASGGWNSYTFEVFGAYNGSAAGTFTFQSPSFPTTRYKMFVTPQDLMSFGVSMLGREITFDKTILQIPNRGASRFISFYGNDYVVIDQTEFSDPLVPVLHTPFPGDTFSLSVQRQGGEVTTENLGTSQDVTIAPSPLINVPNFGIPPVIPSMPSKGPIEISTGPQPGAPIITGGVQVPTAINVNVADQATSVGLPTNVYV